MHKLSHKSEFFALLTFIFLLCAGVIWIRTATVRDTYRYVQREKELKKLEFEIQAARVQWLRLTAPKRLDQLAQAIGLHPPRIDQVLKYDSREKPSAETVLSAR